MNFAEVTRRGDVLAKGRVEERLARMEAVVGDALASAAIERRGGRIAARGPGVRRRALEDSRVRFMGYLS